MKDNKNDEAVEAEIVEENQVVLKEIKYPVGISDINTLLDEYKDIPSIDPNAEDKDLVGTQYQFVLKGHKAFVKVRGQIEKTRKELKAPSLEYGKKVDDIAKEFQAKIKPIEDKLFIQRKAVDDNEARIQREAEEAEELRMSTIKNKILDVKNLPLQYFNSNCEDITKALESLRIVTKEEFEEFFDEAAENQNHVVSQLQTARDNKILVENAQKIEDERKKEALQKEIKLREQQQEEQKKLDDERKAFEQQKIDFEQQQREQQETINRQNAEREADDLMKKQEQEKADRLKLEQEQAERKRLQDTEVFDNAYNETLDKFEAYDSMTALLDSIIDGVEFKHLKWEVQSE